MKFAEAIGAPLFNGNGLANTSLIQSEPLGHRNVLKKQIRVCPMYVFTLSLGSWRVYASHQYRVYSGSQAESKADCFAQGGHLAILNDNNIKGVMTLFGR